MSAGHKAVGPSVVAKVGPTAVPTLGQYQHAIWGSLIGGMLEFLFILYPGICTVVYCGGILDCKLCDRLPTHPYQILVL